MGCPLIEAAVKIVSGDDRRTALGVFISGTVIGIVTALDAGTRTTGFDELDVVVVAQANTTLRVAVSTGTSAGVVLASCVARVQPIDCLGTDTPSDCKSEVGMKYRGGGVNGGKVEAAHVGRSVLRWVRFRFGTRHFSRSWKEVHLARESICRQVSSTFAFHHLITIESQNPWAEFNIGQGETYGCSLSPMLVCGSLGMIILHPE